MNDHVTAEIFTIGESPGALVTGERALAGMSSQMEIQRPLEAEALSTMCTHEGSLT